MKTFRRLVYLNAKYGVFVNRLYFFRSSVLCAIHKLGVSRKTTYISINKNNTNLQMTKRNEFDITSCAIEEISDSAKHNILRLRENKI